MVLVTRRNALQLGGGILGIIGSGCTALEDESPEETYLNDLTVLNRDRTEYTLFVLMIKGEKPVYWNSVDVDAYSEEEDRAGGGEFTNYPTDPGSYSLYVWRDDQPRSEWEQVDFDEFDHPTGGCVEIMIMVGDASDEDHGNISILHSISCRTGADSNS